MPFDTAALGAIAGKQLKAVDRGTLRFGLIVGLFFSLAMLLEGVALNDTTPAKSNFFGNVSCVTVPIFVAVSVLVGMDAFTWSLALGGSICVAAASSPGFPV